MNKRKNHTILEDHLFRLLQKAKRSSLSLGEILDILSGTGRPLILIFLSLPFCLPIQIPGFSTPFGIAIAFIGLRMAFGKHIWLPKRLLSKKVAPTTLEKIINKTLWLERKIRYLLRPRLIEIVAHPVMRRLNGLIVVVLGIFSTAIANSPV